MWTLLRRNFLKKTLRIIFVIFHSATMIATSCTPTLKTAPHVFQRVLPLVVPDIYLKLILKNVVYALILYCQNCAYCSYFDGFGVDLGLRSPYDRHKHAASYMWPWNILSKDFNTWNLSQWDDLMISISKILISLFQFLISLNNFWYLWLFSDISEYIEISEIELEISEIPE